MDELDAMILREMVWRPADPHDATRGRRGPWDAARALGLHGTTVKRRIAHLRESGILRGVHVQPVPALVGRRGAEHHFRYRDPEAKRRAFEAIAEDPNVWKATSVVGDRVIANLAAPAHEPLHETAQRLAEHTGAVSWQFHHMTEWPVPTQRISALDLRILAAYADDALRSVADVAAEIGIGAKTVSARMRALERAGAFFVLPLTDHTRIQGGLSLYVDVTLELGASEAAHVEIANRFPKAFCRSVKPAENGCVLLLVSGASDIEETLRRAQTIPGAQRIEVHILHEVRQEPARWRDALLARAEALARAKGQWAPSWRATPSAS